MPDFSKPASQLLFSVPILVIPTTMLDASGAMAQSRATVEIAAAAAISTVENSAGDKTFVPVVDEDERLAADRSVAIATVPALVPEATSSEPTIDDRLGTDESSADAVAVEPTVEASTAIAADRLPQYATTAAALAPTRTESVANGPILIAETSELETAAEAESTTSEIRSARPATDKLGRQQHWSFSAELLYLERTIEDVDTAVDVDTRAVFGTDALEFDLDAGARFTLGYHIDPTNSIEVSYFGLHEWNDSVTFTSSPFEPNTPENLNAAFKLQPFVDDNPDPEDFNQALSQDIDYSTDLDNFELNYRRQLIRGGASDNFQLAFVAGFRYLNLNENFDLVSDDGVGEDKGTYEIDTDNDLFGLQIGGDATFQISRHFGLGLRARAGLLFNSASQRSKLVNFNTVGGSGIGQDVFRGDGSRTDFSSLVELGIFAHVDINSNVSIRAGYNFLNLGNIATAPGQFADSPNFPDSLSGLNRTSVSFSGPSIGITARF